MDDDNRFHEALVALFGLGVVAFSPLVLDVFDGPQRIGAPTVASPAVVFDVPLLYAYLFVAWGVLIALMALVVRRANAADASLMPEQREREENE